jgi:hypothetical protein
MAPSVMQTITGSFVTMTDAHWDLEPDPDFENIYMHERNGRTITFRVFKKAENATDRQTLWVVLTAQTKRAS